MNQTYTASERDYAGYLKSLPCVICKRIGFKQMGGSELHHIAAGSSRQNNWLVVPLCQEHHRGGSGLHGLGTRRFCVLYRVPHESEYGLLAFVNEDLMHALGLKNIA